MSPKSEDLHKIFVSEFVESITSNTKQDKLVSQDFSINNNKDGGGSPKVTAVFKSNKVTYDNSMVNVDEDQKAML